MHLGIKLILAASLALIFARARPALAATQDDLNGVLHSLDVAAANFHSTSADVEFDTIETDPVYDKDVQIGIVYYDRKENAFRMGVHITQHNNKPSAKAYTYAGGALKLFEPGIDQVTTYAKAGKWESYVMLGFGASGKDLQARWDIKYLGSEPISDGKTTVKTEILELVPKDPEVRKNLPKVTVWVDPGRAVSLKQVFTLSATDSRVCVYSNFKLNQPLPADAFTFKTDRQTVYRNQ
ncbi:MAG TPA: outer membrane lipoprotein-sorting protein [Terracidiphilus sp.]